MWYQQVHIYMQVGDTGILQVVAYKKAALCHQQTSSTICGPQIVDHRYRSKYVYSGLSINRHSRKQTSTKI